MARKQVTTGKAPTESVTTDTIPFDQALAEGKEIVAKIHGRNEATERDHFRLGELAAKVETKYDDRTQAKLAKEWGISPSCLKRYVSVYRAWKGIQLGAPGAPIGVPYSMLRELATLDDREQIIRDKPNITKREAEQLRRKRNGTGGSAQQQEEPQGSFLTEKRRYQCIEG
jgi:hypothetical protein